MTDKEAQMMIAARAEISRIERAKVEPLKRSLGFHGPEDPDKMSHSEDMLEYARKYAAQSANREQRVFSVIKESHQMNDDLKAQVSAQENRIERLEAWILEVISKPYMPRELRLEGMEIMNPVSAEVKKSVERICPTQSLEMGREQSIDL